MFILLVLGLVATQTAALYGPGTNVVELTEANFDRLVVNSDEVWVVEFFAPWCGHCQQLVPEYKKLATALKGVVKVGSVNADDHKTLGGTYGVRGFPTIKIFGGNKRKPDDFNGERTAQGMANAALAAAKKKVSDQLGGKSGGSSDNSGGSSGGDDVIELTDANFKKLVLDSDEMWLVEFFAPWCGHCKNLEPQWAKAASSLRGKFKLGALDATVHKTIAARYEIQGYPTIKYFPADRKNDPVDYDGGRTSGDIVNWATDKLAENIPAPEVVQITGADVFAAECDKKPLCVVSVLPHILDCQAECRNQYLDLLKAMGEKYKQKMWGWLWSEGGSQMELESSLDIGGFGYPAMAVVNVKKMKYSLFRGSFSKDGIIEFLRDLSFGRGNTAPIKGAQLPTVIKSEKWDGNDGELPQEEEIDLTDVDLDKEEL